MLADMTTNEPPPPDPFTPTSDLPSYGSVPPPEGGYPPPPGGFPPPAPGGYGLPPETNKSAMWSLILGIISPLCCGIVLGPVAIALSRRGKTEIAYSRGQQTGDGMATAGLVLGIVGIVVWTLGIIARIALAT
jgi:hypothetical protein